MLDKDFNRLKVENWKILLRRDFQKCNIMDLLSLNDKHTKQQNAFVAIPSSRYTDVYKGNVSTDDTIYHLYLKKYRCRSFLDFLKHLFRFSPAKRSFQASIMLQNNGLDAPDVIGLFERRTGLLLIDNLLLTTEVENAKSLVECLRNKHKVQDEGTLLRKRSLIEQFGKTVGKMHSKGILHGDLRLGNVLVQQKQGNWRFFFLDNERTKKFERLSQQQRLKNLVQINLFRENITNTDRMRFFKKYCAQNTQNKNLDKTLAKQILQQTGQRLVNKNKPTKGMKKYLRTNQIYLRIKTGQWTAVFDRSFCEETDAVDFINNIADIIRQGDYLKKGDTSSVSHSTWNDKHIVTKQYKYRGILHSLRHTIKRSRAVRSWLNGHRLLNLGIPTSKPLAYIEQRRGLLVMQSYLINEYVQGRNLSEFARDNNVSDEQLSRITGQIEKILERLAEYRISHGDLKDTNILITQNGPVLTDLDAMKVHRFNAIYKIRRAKDLARFRRNPSVYAKNRADKTVPV